MTDTTNPIIDISNLTVGIYNYELFMAKYSNVLIQYKLFSGNDNIIIMNIYGTVYENAILTSDAGWSDVTELLTEEVSISAFNATVHNLAAVDTQIPFNKLKFLIAIYAASPANNSIKIGFSV